MNKISIKPSAVSRFLGTVALLLVLASIAGQFSIYVLGYGYLKRLVPLFYVNAERNIPTFFSTLLMLFAALLLAYIAALHRKQRLPHVLHWAIFSFGFLVMAFDEVYSCHEKLTAPFQILLGG